MSLPADSVPRRTRSEAETGAGRDEHGAVTVLIAEEDRAACAAIRGALEQHGFTVVAEARNADEAVAAVAAERPGVCLLSLDLPGGGMHTLEEISRRAPDARLAVLSDSLTQLRAIRAVRAGATGYFLKALDPDRMATAVQAMVRGEAALPRAVTAGLAEELRRADGSGPRPRLWIARVFLYPPRFARHFQRRRRSGMPRRAAWSSARRRMQSYR